MKEIYLDRAYITTVVDPENLQRAPTQHPQSIPSIDLTMTLNKFSGYIEHGSIEEIQQINGLKRSDSSKKTNDSTTLSKIWIPRSQSVGLAITFLLLWGVAYSVLPGDLTQPDSALLRFCFLFIGAYIAGELTMACDLSEMVGAFFFGVLYANLGLADFRGYTKLEGFLGDMTVVGILLCAGQGTEYEALKMQGRFIVQLAVFPSIVEVSIVATMSHYLLELPWLWGVLLGLLVTAISPNVIVTMMRRLAELKMGTERGLRTIMINTTALNDIIVIYLFVLVTGVLFSTDDLTTLIIQGPIGMAIGLCYGCFCGLMLQHVPSFKALYSNGLRFTMVAAAGTLAIVGSRTIGYPSAGNVGCISTAFVASALWKRRADFATSEVSLYTGLFWKFWKIVSFALVGKEVRLELLQDEVALYGLVILLVAAVFRLLFSFLSTLGSNLDWREKMYVTVSGLPKSMVPAAFGPMVLRMCQARNNAEEMQLAHTMMVVCAVDILLTLPLSALLMFKLAPAWIKKDRRA
uniref:Mitochondrial sodium/hydrogen exchanger 9B2 n=2 Tax=Culex pipiens TaxID=7175 RepID=A0A8D8B9Q4_CULPI